MRTCSNVLRLLLVGSAVLFVQFSVKVWLVWMAKLGTQNAAEEYQLARDETNSKHGKVAFLFMIRNKVLHPDLWEFWLNEAVQWGRETYRIDTVSTYVHHDSGEEPSNVEAELPSSLKQSLISPVVECRWGVSNPCMIRLLEEAVNRDPTNQFFVYLSESHVPVVLFRDVYTDLIFNPRSRIFISNLNFFPSPKHDQWVILNRRHAELLLENRASWNGGVRPGHFYPSGRRVEASDNEFFLLKTLIDNYPSREALWKDLNFGIILPPSQDIARRMTFGLTAIHTFVCWSKVTCPEIGDFVPKRRPFVFTSVRAEEFEKQVISAKYWFARKFTEGCFVDDTGLTKRHEDWQPLELSLWLKNKMENVKNQGVNVNNLPSFAMHDSFSS